MWYRSVFLPLTNRSPLCCTPRSLRPHISEVVHAKSDIVIFTNDSPRVEPPEQIIQVRNKMRAYLMGNLAFFVLTIILFNAICAEIPKLSESLISCSKAKAWSVSKGLDPLHACAQDMVAGLPEELVNRYSGYVYFPFQDQGRVPLWFEPYLQRAQRTTKRCVSVNYSEGGRSLQSPCLITFC